MTTTPDPIAAIERETESEIRRAAVNLVDTLVLERETNGQSKEFMDWAVFMTVRAFKEQCVSLVRQAAEKDAEIAEKEKARSEQWRMRREAEASRDTEMAISHSLKLERDELVTAMEGVVHFGDALNYREDHLSKALRQWIEAGSAILDKINAARSLTTEISDA